MTDEDVYGKTLGKPFRAVAAELCRPESLQDEQVAVAAKYLRRHLLHKDRELRQRLRAGTDAFEGTAGLFGLPNASEAFHASRCDSLASQDCASAFERTRNERGDARRFHEQVAQTTLDAVRTLTNVQTEYKDNALLRDTLDRLGPAIVKSFADDLSRECGVKTAAPSTRLRRSDDDGDLLNFVVAQ